MTNPLQASLFQDESRQSQRPVECLGLTFENDEARRAYFTEKLREKLKDPAFRQIEGFPIGSDEDILALSGPPYYTACPNPFLAEFISHYGKPFDPVNDQYQREPLTLDVSEGRSDPIYNAHRYATKLPHHAIMQAILHYTDPGDVILDGFSGSGMVGVAAQVCAQPPERFKQTLEKEWEVEGKPTQWGARRVVLNDLSPTAGFISANYNLPFAVEAFVREANRILEETKQELGWMYDTLHTDGRTKGQINHTVWSEIFSCSKCGGEINFFDQALDNQAKRIRRSFACPHCQTELTRRELERIFEADFDPVLGKSIKRLKRQPVLINYTINRDRFEKQVDENDLTTLRKIENLSSWPELPANEIPFMHLTHQQARIDTLHITHLHHLYLPRAAYTLGVLWQKIRAVDNVRLRHMLVFWFDNHLVRLSLQNRYSPRGSSAVFSGLYYLPPLVSETNPFTVYKIAARRLSHVSSDYRPLPGNTMIGTGDSGNLSLIPDNHIDYIFTDPPVADYIYYSDLNFLVESWYKVWTNAEAEAIVDKARVKELLDYQNAMQRCFKEYYRVLKSGRWITIVFRSSSAHIWKVIQEVIFYAGFIVAGVYTLDKKQKSYRKISSSAVRQDLVISAYKPTHRLDERFALHGGMEAGVWDFVEAHLRQLPVFIQAEDGWVEIIDERLDYALFERMVTFHKQRGVMVPISVVEFFAGLEQRFPARDEMYFLSDQVAEYDQKRMRVKRVRPVKPSFIDETQVIHWLQSQLTKKPQTSQEIRSNLGEPLVWPKYDKPLELDELLEQNFLCYDGQGPIPEQIWNWLCQRIEYSHQTREQTRKIADASLRAIAKGRWYLPDSNEAKNLESLKEEILLKEFKEYVQLIQKSPKSFRLEVVQVGCEKAFREEDYQTIITVTTNIPDEVLLEYPKLLFWHDQAVVRMNA